MVTGITVSFLIGPLLFMIVQASLERGFRAGFSIGAGIWLGDAMYVLATWQFLRYFEKVVNLPHFAVYAGLIGGILLIAFGVANFWTGKQKQYFGKKKPEENAVSEGVDLLIKQVTAEMPVQNKTYLHFFFKGFFINLINPFTIFFWLGLSSAVVVPSGWNDAQAADYFIGLFAALIFFDCMKAYGAKKVRKWLTPEHILKARRGIGLALICFGLALIIRVL